MNSTIEHQLFTWESWDELGVGDLYFYDVTFVADVGPFKVGDTASGVSMLLSQSKIEVYDEKDEVAFTGHLKLVVEDGE